MKASLDPTLHYDKNGRNGTFSGQGLKPFVKRQIQSGRNRSASKVDAYDWTSLP